MSIKATNFVRRLRGISPEEKAVAFVLADHDSHKGNGAYPSMMTVAQEAGLRNRETASRIMARLVVHKVIQTPHPSKGRKPTVYFFNHEIANCDSGVTVANPRTVTRESQLPFPNRDSEPVGKAPTVTLKGSNRDSPVTGRVLKGKERKGEAARVENHVQQSTLLELATKKNHHPPPPWAKGGLREELWRGIHYQKVSGTFFDSRHLKPADRLKDCIAVTVTSVFTARVATLKPLSPNEVERRAFAELLRDGADKTLELVKDFEARQRQTVQTVTRAVIDVCTEMLNGAEHATT